MASTSGMKSRCRDKVFLIDYPAHQITGCKLPSNRQVLSTMFYNLRTVKLNVRDSATTSVDEVFVFWTKARIPTKQKRNVIVKLEKLYDDWRKMQKYKDRKTESARNAVKEFTLKLDDLFDIAHQDALAMMTSEEDKEFLLKQRQKGRPGSMLGVDLKLAQAEERLLQKQRKVLEKQLEAGNLGKHLKKNIFLVAKLYKI